VNRRLALPLLALLAAIVLPSAAHAQYLDPGAGSIILQAVVAIVVALAAVLKLYWGKLSAIFSRERKTPER
jgi:hypothetical protein